MTKADLNAGSLQAELQSLSARLTKLEAKHKPSDGRDPAFATDPFATRMLVSALSAGFTQTLFTRCEPDYYDRPLEYRRGYLRAASTHHLTKSIVLHNTRYTPSDAPPSHPLRGRFVCCVVPYTAKINSDLLRDAVRKLLGQVEGAVPSAKGFNFRLAENCTEVTGYEPNAVTPLGIKTDMPIVVAKQIAVLQPATFWLGGGEVSLKWRVERDEFLKVFNPFVLDFAQSDDA